MISYFLEYQRWSSLIGIVAIIMIAILSSRNRAAIVPMMVVRALLLQAACCFFVLKTVPGLWILQRLADMVSALYRSADAGISFLFGGLADVNASHGFIFAIRVLPIMIFFGAFMNILFYYGIVQRMVGMLNRLVQPLLGTSGPETACAVANSFLGQTEAPLLIRHYLARMSESELFTVMVAGMGTLSGPIIAVYGSMGVPVVHLLTASVMAIPATLLLAKLYEPTQEARHEKIQLHKPEQDEVNLLGAIAQGTSDGLQLALNVGAALIAFVALVALLNMMLGVTVSGLNQLFHTGLPKLSVEMILGWLGAPGAWILGLRGAELWKGGELLGLKVAVNEMVAYTVMVGATLTPRALMLLTYALAGFSNFSSIGIQVGGIGVLAPNQRPVLAKLGLRAVIAACLANLLSACIVNLFV